MSAAPEQHIYNTLSRRKEPLRTLQPGKLGLYVCGMTVYDYCHLGHARVLVVFDVVTRWLRASGLDVTYVRNITDIEDKILRRAEENGEDFRELTARFIDAMHEDERRLEVLPPDVEPRATGYMDHMHDMISRLIEKGHAYVADNGDVYYAVSSFADYGKLSRKDPEELLAGARVDVEPAKRDPRDFALWKSTTTDEVHWPSPWGPGRPGWHIECSAMSTQCLGDEFDIHGGGPDLPFPHHENEIAQSEAATGKSYAQQWMHAGAVRVDGEKMSKSLGNFFTIRDVLTEWHPEVVRYLLISSHYRSAINYSLDTLKTAKQALDRFYQTLREIPPAGTAPTAHAIRDRFTAAMADDFNTPVALAALFDLVREINNAATPAEAGALSAMLVELGGLLGLLQQDAEAFLQSAGSDALTAEAIDALVAEREQAKRDKDYARADAIRSELAEAGVVLEDSREGTRWRRQ